MKLALYLFCRGSANPAVQVRVTVTRGSSRVEGFPAACKQGKRNDYGCVQRLTPAHMGRQQCFSQVAGGCQSQFQQPAAFTRPRNTLCLPEGGSLHPSSLVSGVCTGSLE